MEPSGTEIATEAVARWEKEKKKRSERKRRGEKRREAAAAAGVGQRLNVCRRDLHRASGDSFGAGASCSSDERTD